tara:strand:+ start:505 stop:897 length:393 start_codon:yes stop_codon:yes gene_type:complete
MNLTTILIWTDSDMTAADVERVQAVDLGGAPLGRVDADILDDHSGGTKFWTSDIWLACANWLETRNPNWMVELGEAFGNPRHPRHVPVWMIVQDDAAVGDDERVYRLVGTEWRQLRLPWIADLRERRPDS